MVGSRYTILRFNLQKKIAQLIFVQKNMSHANFQFKFKLDIDIRI